MNDLFVIPVVLLRLGRSHATVLLVCTAFIVLSRMAKGIRGFATRSALMAGASIASVTLIFSDGSVVSQATFGIYVALVLVEYLLTRSLYRHQTWHLVPLLFPIGILVILAVGQLLGTMGDASEMPCVIYVRPCEPEPSSSFQWPIREPSSGKPIVFAKTIFGFIESNVIEIPIPIITVITLFIISVIMRFSSKISLYTVAEVSVLYQWFSGLKNNSQQYNFTE